MITKLSQLVTIYSYTEFVLHSMVLRAKLTAHLTSLNRMAAHEHTGMQLFYDSHYDAMMAILKPHMK